MANMSSPKRQKRNECQNGDLGSLQPLWRYVFLLDPSSIGSLACTCSDLRALFGQKVQHGALLDCSWIEGAYLLASNICDRVELALLTHEDPVVLHILAQSTFAKELKHYRYYLLPASKKSNVENVVWDVSEQVWRSSKWFDWIDVVLQRPEPMPMLNALSMRNSLVWVYAFAAAVRESRLALASQLLERLAWIPLDYTEYCFDYETRSFTACELAFAEAFPCVRSSEAVHYLLGLESLQSFWLFNADPSYFLLAPLPHLTYCDADLPLVALLLARALRVVCGPEQTEADALRAAFPHGAPVRRLGTTLRFYKRPLGDWDGYLRSAVRAGGQHFMAEFLVDLGLGNRERALKFAALKNSFAVAEGMLQRGATNVAEAVRDAVYARHLKLCEWLLAQCTARGIAVSTERAMRTAQNKGCEAAQEILEAYNRTRT